MLGGEECHAMKSHVHFAWKGVLTHKCVRAPLHAKVTRRFAACASSPPLTSQAKFERTQKWLISEKND